MVLDDDDQDPYEFMAFDDGGRNPDDGNNKDKHKKKHAKSMTNHIFRTKYFP